jgi:hypothetical protein
MYRSRTAPGGSDHHLDQTHPPEEKTHGVLIFAGLTAYDNQQTSGVTSHEPTNTCRPAAIRSTPRTEGFESLAELALDMRWSWNHGPATARAVWPVFCYSVSI